MISSLLIYLCSQLYCGLPVRQHELLHLCHQWLTDEHTGELIRICHVLIKDMYPCNIPFNTHCWSDKLGQIKVFGGPDLRPFLRQVQLHHAHLTEICAQQDLPLNCWKWSTNVCDNMRAAQFGNLMEACRLGFWEHQHFIILNDCEASKDVKRADRPAC